MSIYMRTSVSKKRWWNKGNSSTKGIDCWTVLKPTQMLTRNVNVDRMVAGEHETHRQRSLSLTGTLSRSADWTEELEKRLRGREVDGGEYLMGYRGGGSQPICATRRSSCGQVSLCAFQDVFTGEQRTCNSKILGSRHFLTLIEIEEARYSQMFFCWWSCIDVVQLT